MQPTIPPSIPRSLKLSPKKFQSLVQFKCLRALVDPGEAIGLLASQVRVQESFAPGLPTAVVFPSLACESFTLLVSPLFKQSYAKFSGETQLSQRPCIVC